jgi:hypothetical protein
MSAPTSPDASDVTNNAGGSDDGDDDGPSLALLASIWDDDRVKPGEKDGSKGWTCGWFNCFYKQQNAIKAVTHLSKTKGFHICKFPATIPGDRLARYHVLLKHSKEKKTAKKRASKATASFIADLQEEAARDLMSKKSRRSSSATIPVAASSAAATGAIITGGGASAGTFSFPPSIDRYGKGQQITIKGSNETMLEMAIADLCRAEGLSFSLAQSQRFRRVLTLARGAGSNFKTPGRELVLGKLLDINYERCKERNVRDLKREASVLGLSFLGNGATIKKMPLINVLASSAAVPAVVLEIHDCTEHMAGGGEKDAPYIADFFLEHFKAHDENKRLTDLLLFDGAQNVQKAGKILEASQVPSPHQSARR